MDDIETYEIFELIQLIPWANKISYEQMRYNVWASLKPHLKNDKITPERLLPLYTDRNSYNTPELSQEEIDKYEAIKKHIKEQYHITNS